MKKTYLLALLFLTISILTFNSCISTAASIANSQILDTNEEQYVKEELYRYKNVDLSNSQIEEATSLFRNIYKESRENAHKEKSGVINNKASANNLIYILYKKQVKFEKILTKEQLITSRESGYGMNADQLAKQKRKLKKMGYNVNI